MPEISVIIHTKNAAKTLRLALKSVMLLADEMLVVDMKSEDETVAIAKELGAKVISVQDAGYADPARQMALQKAKGPWILVIDADEEIPKTLSEYLKNLSENMEVQAYELPRKNMIFGHWAKTGWWPDYAIRFFQKGFVEWPAEVHGKPTSSGITMRVPPEESLAILHHNYDSVEQFIDRLNRYTSLEATQKQESKPLFSAFFHEYFQRYYVARGVEQGQYGLILSMLQACYMLIAEIKRAEQKGFSTDQPIQNAMMVEEDLDALYREVCYWIADERIRNAKNIIEKMYWRIRKKLQV